MIVNIGFERDKDGNLIAVDKDTGKQIGTVDTMGDEVKKEK